MQANLFLEQRGKWFWGVGGLVLVIALGAVDYYSGYELSFSLFYLGPIALVTWYAGRRLGLVISGASAITWFLADVLSGDIHSSAWIFLWNTLIRLGFFVIVTVLIAELRKAYRANQELARTDYITGALSVRYFYEVAKTELSRSNRYQRPFTLAYFDLDDFKQVNDRFGHNTGDEVLRTVSRNVKRQIRNVDIFARVGGDEFVLLMPETGEVEAQAVISRIRHGLLDEMQRSGWPITFSFGVVTCTKIPKTVDDVVKMADDVMAPVKMGGKNGVSYTIYEG